jgi:hypothetical protein
MLWLVENNVAKEELYDELISSMDRLNINYQIIKVIPFTQDTIPEITTDEPIAVYGSVRLCNKIAPTRGWQVFTNDNFDFEVWSKMWDGHLLNGDYEIGPFDSVAINHEQFFIRPCKDNKAFTGKVLSISSYHDWLDQLRIVEESSHGDLQFDISEMVMVSPVQHIQQEVRFYIVDGKIITHSAYQCMGQVLYKDETFTDPAAVQFVQDMIDIWVPDAAFVIDVAMVGYQWKVIEINCINCSGLYKSNVGKLINALHNCVTHGE